MKQPERIVRQFHDPWEIRDPERGVAVIAPECRFEDVACDVELTFLDNRDSPYIRGGVARSEQVGCIATGSGFRGTSREYLANIVDHFVHSGIVDDHSTGLLREVDADIAARCQEGPSR